MSESIPVCDSHVHVGYLRDRYFGAERVVSWLQSIGVESWVFSCSSASNMPWNYVRLEYEGMMRLSAGKGYPLLWLTPSMLRASPDLKLYEGFPWHGIKLHGYNGWDPSGKPINRVLHLAKEYCLPVMLHTGGRPCCEAGRYLRICRSFSEVPFVLAHGRPIQEAIHVLRECENTWVDTAFMPLTDVVRLINEGLGDRIVYGTDLPAPACFLASSVVRYVKRRLKRIKEISGPLWRKISYENAACIYSARVLTLGNETKGVSLQHQRGINL